MTQACQLRRGLDVKTMEFVCGLQLRDSHFPRPFSALPYLLESKPHNVLRFSPLSSL